MRNNVLKLTVALGFVLVSSTTMNAQKTWRDLERADDTDGIRSAITVRLDELEGMEPSDYRDAKISLWKTRAAVLNDLSAQFIDNQVSVAFLHELVSTDEGVTQDKATAKFFKDELKREKEVGQSAFFENEFGLFEQMIPAWSQRVTREHTENFASIRIKVEELSKSQQNSSVHTALDDYYAEKSAVLLKIADDLFPGKGDLSLIEIKSGLKLILEDHPELLNEYNYEGAPVSKEAMISYIDKVYQNDMPVRLCSHTYNLAFEMLFSHSDRNEYGIHRLFDAIAENYLTGGGCLDGRRNRQFTALTSLLGHLAL